MKMEIPGDRSPPQGVAKQPSLTTKDFVKDNEYIGYKRLCEISEDWCLFSLIAGLHKGMSKDLKHIKRVKEEEGYNCDCLHCCCKSLQSCPTVRPHRRQPTRLPRPWDSPGKNTGVGCHFLLQCMKVKSESEVAQSCPTLSDPRDCSPPGSSVHGFSRQESWSGVPLPSPDTVHRKP